MASPLPDVLPMFFSLKSRTNRYLRYIHQDFDGLNGLLQFSGEEVVSPYTKFHAVRAQGVGNNNLVNIQSCYNNKYLRRLDQTQEWIVAGADEPQQDPAIRSCTLFEPITINGVEIKLRLVESDAFLKISHINECLLLSPNNFDIFTVIDWNKFVILPKHLAFKGYGGSYISVNKDDATDPYLHFSDNQKDETVENEVFPALAGDGSVSIYSTYKQKFWRLNRDVGRNNTYNWIWADAIDVVDVEARFWPDKVHPNVDDDVVVTLRNLGSNNICKRLDNYLNAGPVNVPSSREHLAVEELVTSRTISILNFHALTDARIYNRTIDKVVATEAVENSTQRLVSKTIWLSYEDTKDSTWNTSTEDLAFTAIIPTTLTSDTPFLLDGGRIGVSGNFNGTYQWGEHHKSSTQIKRPVRVDVPPLRMVTVTLLATEASCDIPFNYSKNDTLFPGQRTTYNEEVGLYTGVSLYNFHHNAEEGQLPPADG